MASQPGLDPSDGSRARGLHRWRKQHNRKPTPWPPTPAPPGKRCRPFPTTTWSPVSVPGAAPAPDSRPTRSGARTCAAAANVPQTANDIRGFLKQNLDVYGLRAANDNPNGLITGYYEPVYPGSLTQTAAANIPVYGVPEDMIIVSLDSIYPELKGKRLRGRLEGRVLKPYDDAATIETKGVKAPVVAWLTDPMNLQFLQIQGSGRIQLDRWPPAAHRVCRPERPPLSTDRPLAGGARRAEERRRDHGRHQRLGQGQSDAHSGTARQQPELCVFHPQPGQQRRAARLAERTVDRRLQRGGGSQGDSAGQPVVVVHHPTGRHAHWFARWRPRTPAARLPAKFVRICSGAPARRPGNWPGT